MLRETLWNKWMTYLQADIMDNIVYPPAISYQGLQKTCTSIQGWCFHWCQQIKQTTNPTCVVCSTKPFHLPLGHIGRLIFPHLVAGGLDHMTQFWPIESEGKWHIALPGMIHKISPLGYPLSSPPFAVTLETTCWRWRCNRTAVKDTDPEGLHGEESICPMALNCNKNRQ